MVCSTNSLLRLEYGEMKIPRLNFVHVRFLCKVACRADRDSVLKHPGIQDLNSQTFGLFGTVSRTRFN